MVANALRTPQRLKNVMALTTAAVAAVTVVLCVVVGGQTGPLTVAAVSLAAAIATWLIPTRWGFPSLVALPVAILVAAVFGGWVSGGSGWLIVPLVIVAVNDVAVVMVATAHHQKSATDDLDLILRATRALSRTVTVHETASVAEQHLRRLLRFDDLRAFVPLPGGQPGQFLDLYDPEHKVSVDLSHEPGAVGVALASAQPSWVSNTRQDPRIPLCAIPSESALYLPITTGNATIGAFLAIWRTSTPPPDDTVVEVASVVAAETGITLARQRQAENSETEAATDPLTGLLNRRSITERIAGLEAGDTVLVIDLDHFKEVNDTHGHERGDQVLRALAACMSSTFRADDWAGRLGGDEFIAVLHHTHGDAIQVVIDRLLGTWNEMEPTVSYSLGYATHEDGAEPDATVKAADDCLYEKKRSRPEGIGRRAFTPSDEITASDN